MNKCSTWRFPPNLKACPLRGCTYKFESRSLAIQHYKDNHASTSALCFICKKPISVKNNWANFRTHFKLMHPHVKFSHKNLATKPKSSSQIPKIEPNSTSNSNIVQPPKHSVNVRSSIMQSQDKKKRCTICGGKFRKLNRHVMEVHSKKRILCPLKSCDFTAQRLGEIRRHWKNAHEKFRFPEIEPNSGFTYRTTTVDTPECVSNLAYFLLFSFNRSSLKFIIFFEQIFLFLRIVHIGCNK